MTAPAQNPANNAITGNFTIQATLPNGKTMNISGYVYDGETVESVNDRVDLFHDILDRQRVRSEIPELEAKRDQTVAALGQMRDVMANLDKKKSEGVKLTSQEKQTLENLALSVKHAQENIQKGETAIAEAKIKAGLTK
jgi:hypothetical protein